MSFRRDLEKLINKHSIENLSDTPDYILAEYVMSCLDAFEKAIRDRRKHEATEPKKKFD